MMFRQYSNITDAIHALTLRLISCMSGKGKDEVFNLALSGGNTARDIFRVWICDYADKIDWQRIHFYWVDERCVAPDSMDSNYRHANELLFVPLGIRSENIHRIWGENVPEMEAERYEAEIRRLIPVLDDLPLFDCIILGVGEDMHTASIFPGCRHLLIDERLYAVSRYPETRMFRVTMTGKAILCGAQLLIPVWGESKKHVVDALKDIGRNCERMQDCADYSSPISFIVSSAGDLADVITVV